MEEEMNSLNGNNTFTLTALPDSRQAVGGKWVYTIKESPSMAKTYKARYVAKGYSQIKDIDYHETFAPTANLTTVRALMQIAAKHDLITSARRLCNHLGLYVCMCVWVCVCVCVCVKK